VNEAEQHRLPPRTLTAIATGETDASDVALLTATRRSRLLLALVGAYELPPVQDRLPDDWPRTGTPPTLPRTAWKLLCGIQRAHPAAVEAVLSDPTVSGWVLQLLRRLGHDTGSAGQDAPLWADFALIGSLSAAAAIRSGTRCSLRVPARRGRLWLPSLGVTGRVARGEWAVVGVERTARGTVVFGDSGSVRLPKQLSRPSEGWEPLPRVDPADGIDGVALDHLSPHRDFHSLRDPARLSADALAGWRQLVAEATELLREDHPPSHLLVRAAIRSLVPVAAPSPERPVSATVPEAYGLVIMSLPPDASTTAATLVHESYHQLLAAADDVTPLLALRRTGPEPLHFAPWREDPRPLRGLLYGTHATAGMTAFWQRRRGAEGDRADFEFAFHRWQLRVSLAALHSADGLTPEGGLLVCALTGQAARWWPEQVAKAPGELAARCCADLAATWRATHLTVGGPDADLLARRWLAGEPPPGILPAARLAPAYPKSRLLARRWLTRLWLADPAAFGRLRTEFAAGAVDRWGAAEMTPGDLALVAGDRQEARALFHRATDLAGQPANVSDWVGLGLALPEPGPLVERPELVIALYGALLRAGTHPPGPQELARWLAPPARGAPAPRSEAPRSEAECVDVAVGP
jgi:HEXXH motif-containing protein